MNIKLVSIIVGILLILAIPSGFWPYGYYTFLRWTVFFASIVIANNFYKARLTGWIFIFAAIAFLFNPLIPIHLDKSAWVGIDLISAVLFFVAPNHVSKNYH